VSSALPSKPISHARRAAFDVLLQVAAQAGHSDDLLYGAALRKLSTQDKALTMALVLGTLRWQIALDAEIRPLLSRPDTKLAVEVQTTLRLGAFQLRHMDRIPVHAAIDESVELAKASGHPHAAGMVNAVLRKLATAPVRRVPLVEPVAAMAERLGHPAWLVERWVRSYGRAAAQAICKADQRESEPASDAPVEAASESSRDEAEALQGATAGIDADAKHGGIFAEMFAVAMDQGSRLIAELTVAAMPEAQQVWDMCAAPGGKTLVLAARLPSAEVLATDVSPRRLARLKERLQGVDNVRVQQADASVAGTGEGQFDLVLCDAPCSGTGTLGRNPEIRFQLEPAELSRQAKRQRALLQAALQSVRVGGRVVYSTCSLEPEENEAVIAAVVDPLRVRQLDVAALIEGMRAQGLLRAEAGEWLQSGALRTLPGANFDGDGFYACVLERLR
jgi:16S rRNA (cytosine967-C5)-methyltransferase